MKKLFASFFFISAILGAKAQAVLPFSWNCDGNPPLGVTFSTPATGDDNPEYYTNVVISGSAYRMDFDNEWIQIEFAEEPGNFVWNFRGTGSDPWNGVVSVQQSLDGNTWSTLKTYNSGDISVTDFRADSATLASSTRFVRIFYTDKQSGYNLAVEDLVINTPGPSAEQEIQLFDNQNNKIPTNGQLVISSPVGTPASYLPVVRNLGTDSNLVINNITLTGPAAADFGVSNFPITLVPNDAAQLPITFTPSGAGTRIAQMNIFSNDADENPYVINLYGVGGTLSTEPTDAPLNLTFSNITSYRFQLDFDAPASLPDGYIIIRKNGVTSISETPTDGTTYQPGDMVGTAKVAYVGNNNTLIPNDIIASTDYAFKIFSYNGFGSNINYLTSSSLSGTTTTEDNMEGNYYASIDETDNSFVDDLTDLIRPHTQIFYSNYAFYMINDFYRRDTTGGEYVFNCSYSGVPYIYTDPFSFSAISREHILSRSWMPTQATDEETEGSDYHNLVPVFQIEVNEVRSNFIMDEVAQVLNTFGEGRYGTNQQGNDCYEPAEDFKGDVARAIMYMLVCYNGEGGEDWGINDLLSDGSQQSQEILKEWHEQDPPSNFEIARNDYIQSFQDNRNPFIDHPEYACYIDFEDLSYIINANGPCQVSIDETLPSSVSVFPNPAASMLQVSGLRGEETLTVINSLGKEVYSVDNSSFTHTINIGLYPSGVYYLLIKDPLGNLGRTAFVKE